MALAWEALVTLDSDSGLDDDRRTYKRHAVLLKGRFLYGHETADCVVSNVSATGARVRLDGSRSLNQVGTLHTDRLGAQPGKVVWSTIEDFGFAFFEEPKRVHAVLEASFPRTATILGVA